MARVEEEPEEEARAEAAEHKTMSLADSCFRSPSPTILDSMKDFVPSSLAGRASPDITPPLTFLASPETDADADSIYEDDLVGARSEWPSQGSLLSMSMSSSTSSLRQKPRQVSPSRPQPTPVQSATESPPPPPPPKYRYLPIEYFNLRKSDHTNHPESSTKKDMKPDAQRQRTISLPQPNKRPAEQRWEPPSPERPTDPTRSQGRSLTGLMPGMSPGPRFGLRTATHAVRVPKLAVAPPQPAPASTPLLDPSPVRPPTRGINHSPERPPTRGLNHSPERPPNKYTPGPPPDHAFVPAPQPLQKTTSIPDLVPAPLAPRRTPYGAATTTTATTAGNTTGLKRTATKKVHLPIPGMPTAEPPPHTIHLTVGGGGGLAVPRRRQPACVPSMAEYLSLEQLENMWHSQDRFAGPVGAPAGPLAAGAGKPASPRYRVAAADPRSPILPIHPAFREGPQVTSPVYPVF